MMQTVIEKKHSAEKLKPSASELVEAEMMKCFHIRERLDDVFSGIFPLEETPEGSKQDLFDHLQTCNKCCRLLDIRVRFRSPGRDRIF